MEHVLQMNILKLRRGRMRGKPFFVVLGICGLHEKLQLMLRSKCWMHIKCGVQQ